MAQSSFFIENQATVGEQLVEYQTTRTGTVDHFTNEQYAGKLIAIGIVPGSRLEVIRKAPFGGSWYVRVDRQCIALRKQELACIVMK